MFDLINCIKQVYPLENRFNFGKFNKHFMTSDF